MNDASEVFLIISVILFGVAAVIAGLKMDRGVNAVLVPAGLFSMALAFFIAQH